MKREPLDLKDLTQKYDNFAGKMNKENEGIRAKIAARIENGQMDPAEIQKIFEEHPGFETLYPELAAIDKMSAEEYSELYKKMAEGIKTDPVSYQALIEASAMSPEKLAELFDQIAGVTKAYPEIAESKETAQLLHPKNLSMLARALKEDAAEAFRFNK
ncbi:MAG: hypothetical protein IJI20_08040 [Firmicutes bacterium]|nr:hypothetical protein [Bacillota bacterium]